MGRPYHPDPPGVGNKLVRLKDVPIEMRLRALRHCIRFAKDSDEARRLLMLAHDPQDKGGRIAA